jgi:hypothetical protein
MSDSIRWTHQGGGGSSSILVDFDAGTRRKETPRPLSADSLAQLRALAEAVEPEHTRLQPSHLTYAQDQMMFITLGEKQVTIDASSGEICEGPPSTLLEAMVALLRTP